MNYNNAKDLLRQRSAGEIRRISFLLATSAVFVVECYYSQQPKKQQQQQQQQQQPEEYLLLPSSKRVNKFLHHQYTWNININKNNNNNKTLCESPAPGGGGGVDGATSPVVKKSTTQQQQQQQDDDDDDDDHHHPIIIHHPSWLRKNILIPLGIMSLPLPRIIQSNDPSLTLSKGHKQQRIKDEENLRKFIQEITSSSSSPKKLLMMDYNNNNNNKDDDDNNEKKIKAAKELGQQIFEITYGKGVTPQTREDFLVKYGCTGYTTEIINYLIDYCSKNGIVEIGAGHGQWSRALSEAYDNKYNNNNNNKNNINRNDNDERQGGGGTNNERNNRQRRRRRRFDFVLAYDDMSNLPLNTHIYNPYTQPHHDYFGEVHEIKSTDHTMKILRSWACRGRALLLVYPPPGPMAMDVVEYYTNAAPSDNDTIIYVGEGRGGANADDTFFDFIESGNWILIQIMDVQPPPGDKGYEKLFVFKRVPFHNSKTSQSS